VTPCSNGLKRLDVFDEVVLKSRVLASMSKIASSGVVAAKAYFCTRAVEANYPIRRSLSQIAR
jgi:hypothetical protein